MDLTLQQQKITPESTVSFKKKQTTTLFLNTAKYNDRRIREELLFGTILTWIDTLHLKLPQHRVHFTCQSITKTNLIFLFADAHFHILISMSYMFHTSKCSPKPGNISAWAFAILGFMFLLSSILYVQKNLSTLYLLFHCH